MHGNFHTINLAESCVIKEVESTVVDLLQVRAMHEQQTGPSMQIWQRFPCSLEVDISVELNSQRLCSCNCSSWARRCIVSMCGYPHLSITFYACYDLLAQAHPRVMQYCHSLSQAGSAQLQALVLTNSYVYQ